MPSPIVPTVAPSELGGLPRAAETVLTFLDSVGKRAEIELYLKIFRELPRESFAIVATEASLITHAHGAIAEQLLYLSDLGLVAPVALGLWEPELAAEAAARLSAALREAGLLPVVLDSTTATAERVRAAIGGLRVPIIVFEPNGLAWPSRFSLILQLATELETRKLVFVRRRGGLGPHGTSHIEFSRGHAVPCHPGGISVINLRTDLEPLLDSDVLDRDDRELLLALADTVVLPGKFLASVTAPLGLLRELFTVKGSGTLVKRGAEVLRVGGYDQLDRGRLHSLLESSFQGRVHPAFYGREPLSVYIESDYRGAAILERGPVAPILSKFAVDPIAQGEGIGRDLWEAMVRDTESFAWRARPTNPIISWYITQCDGMMRTPSWVIFWRKVRVADVPTVVDALSSRPHDIIRDK